MLTMSDIQKIKTLKEARQLLGLSLRETSLLFAKGTTGHVSKSTIASWQSGYRTMPPEAIKRLSGLLAQKFTDETRRTVGVKINVGRSWRITAWGKCVECKKWFRLSRFSIRRCDDCRAQITQNSKKGRVRESRK
jgi:transcriptional regulator with XRE-family HTH domain